MKKFTHWLLLAIAALIAFPSAAATFVGDRSDFRDETIYFMITTRFYDGDPKNNVLCWDGQSHQIANNDPAWRGDFAGLIEKLPYIKALGFTAVWITPVVQNGSGYDYHGYHA
ncbi:MAG: alpha-amylase, partial [Muribaculaceae bacterium]|nr:alpha-amylase [Muribaculaceae bacterium]